MTIGAATDPYQPAEGRYRLTRACIVELAQARTPTSIITRGPLVWRDVDVLQEAARRAEVSVNVSVPTLDDRVWRTTEPGTAPPRKRLEIVRRLVDAGIRTNVAIAPILPGLSDGPEQLAETVRAARQAGAHHIWAAVLHLRPGTREHFLEALARDWPSESARYERLYAGRSYLPASETAPVRDTRRRARARARERRQACASAAAGADAAHPRLTPPVESPRGRNVRNHRPPRRRPRGRARGPSPRPPPLGRTSASSARPPTARPPLRSPSAAAPT